MERQLSSSIMRGGAKPKIRTMAAGETLVAQGDAGSEIYLILDGMFGVDVDGKDVAEIGPGAVVGERAALEGGTRTATLRATTKARVAAVPADQLDPDALGTLASEHHRENGEG
jgi:CRP-like cAMP-binding protein